jgi:hypothetical protein
MIIYLYFNYFNFTNKEFMQRLKVCNLKYGSQEEQLEIHLEEGYYPYCRMKLNDKYLVDDVIHEMGNSIYKFILYN